ncbi:CotS family spore coat protein [Clostridium sp.]|uniref:CotS family spore coat protein n=1 Tax=Clostridium sp. TaxID=1506 RepID=UPI002FCC87DF
MDVTYIKKLVERKYGINPIYAEKIKNVYRVETEDNIYCLKIIKYEFEHFLFIVGAIKHLQNNEFQYVPEIIKTVGGLDYITIDNNYAYLTPWINARESNYDNPLDIIVAAKKLGELHNKSEGFVMEPNMKPRVGWLKWVETYKTRKDEILDFKRRIGKKDVKSRFDLFYLDLMEEELKRCDRSILNLSQSNYVEKMKKEMERNGFCHHDYAHHNVMIGGDGEVNIIDFDYCILDSHLHDLSSLLIRRMKYNKWSLSNAREIIEAYSTVHRLNQEDIPIMAAFIEFPQDYWQRGIQYYWEGKPWGEDFFLKKMQFFKEDREERQEFVEKFRELKL